MAYIPARPDPKAAPVRINLLSDTQTRPTPGMREAMARAEVGDEQFGDDPTTNLLNDRVAELMGKEAAVFLPSGTMCNVTSTLVYCRPGDEILAHVALLRERGPQLGRPYVDTVEGSAFSNMKELRVQFRGEPWRILFAFDPARSAILLVGGSQRGDKRWYKKHLIIPDDRFRRHLERLEHEQ